MSPNARNPAPPEGELTPTSSASPVEPELKRLMLLARDGDAPAYRHLLSALRPRLQGYFDRRLGADPGHVEDLVQETLIAMHTKRATYDPTQPLGAWVYAIARYKLVDHYRRLGRRTFVPVDEDLGLFVDDDTAAADARRDLARGLEALPPRTRDLVVSVKLREEPVADVARRHAMSEGAVKVAVHRGFLRLAAHLKGGKGTE